MTLPENAEAADQPEDPPESEEAPENVDIEEQAAPPEPPTGEEAAFEGAILEEGPEGVDFLNIDLDFYSEAAPLELEGQTFEFDEPGGDGGAPDEGEGLEGPPRAFESFEDVLFEPGVDATVLTPLDVFSPPGPGVGPRVYAPPIAEFDNNLPVLSEVGVSPVSTLSPYNTFKVATPQHRGLGGYGYQTAQEFLGQGGFGFGEGGSRIRGARGRGGDNLEFFTIVNARPGSSGGIIATSFTPLLKIPFLVGTRGFLIGGVPPGDRFGESVSDLGDVNGDGFADFVVGAPGGDPPGRIDAGQSYVFFGSGKPVTALDVRNLDGKNGFVINGEKSGDMSGNSVSGAGDVNGDGLNDILVGASHADPGGKNNAGSAYVIFGKKEFDSGTVELRDMKASDGFSINGKNAGDMLGGSVSGAGDVNGDGFDDIIVGASGADPNGKNNAGEAYVLLGKQEAFTPDVDVSTLNGENGFTLKGVAAGDNLGSDVKGAGDVNGDGVDDLVIGAKDADPGGKNGAGAAYVYMGKRTPQEAEVDLSQLNGKDGFAIVGKNAGDNLGTAVNAAGDVNGDGIGDLIVGSPNADPNGKNGAGESYVILGKTDPFPTTVDPGTLNGSNGFTIKGVKGGDGAGGDVNSIGDVNGDGIDDLAIGTTKASAGGDTAGEGYILFGKDGNFPANVELSNITGKDGFKVESKPTGGKAKLTVSKAGDINGDGFDDITVGTTSKDSSGKESGEQGAIIFGHPSTQHPDDCVATPTPGGKAGDDTLTGNANRNICIGGAGDDILIGKGGADTLIGGSGDDIIVVSDGTFKKLNGSSGNDTLRLDGANFNLDLTKIGNSVITNIDILDLKTDTNAHEVTLDYLDIKGMTDSSNTLRITGDSSDSVIVGELSNFAGPTDNGDGFIKYVNGPVTLLIEQGMKVSGYGFAPIFNESKLNGTNGFKVTGPTDTTEEFGDTVTNLGDVTGDGFDDYAIGAKKADPGGKADAGKSYVVFGDGNSTAANLDVSNLNGSNGFVVKGKTAGDKAGGSISKLGDVNADGLNDFIIGAEGANNGAGESYVVFGKNTAFNAELDVASLDGTNGFTISGVDAGDLAGGKVGSAGDLNADGIDDIVIGAKGGDANGTDSGETYVVFGKSTAFGANVNLSTLDGDTGFVIRGKAAGDNAGSDVSKAGDINGDGVDDLIIGAEKADPGGKADAGESYVVFGNRKGFSSSLELSSLDGNTGFSIQGKTAGDSSGEKVKAAGDMNADGVDDIVIGAPNADPDGKSNAGEGYVVFGKTTPFASTLDLSTLNGTNGFTLKGIDAADGAGADIGGGLDVNGDGRDDLVIGTDKSNPNALDNAPETYVVFGKDTFNSTVELDELDGKTGLIVKASKGANGKTKTSVSSAGDVNGDGFDDILIGTTTIDSGGNKKGGSSTVILGHASDATVNAGAKNINTAKNEDDNLTGTTAGEICIGGAGNDTLNGKGGADTLIGGSGNDTLIIADGTFKKLNGSSGDDTLRLEGANFDLDLTAIKDNKINNIETLDLKTDGNAHTLTLGYLDILKLTDQRNTLRIKGDSADTVEVGELLSFNGPTDNGDGFNKYTNGKVTLLIENTVAVKGFGFSPEFELTKLSGDNGFVINGVGAGDLSGGSVSSAGDVNGDGFDDFIIGAIDGDPNGNSSGESYVVFGKGASFTTPLELSSLNGTTGFVINGIDAGDNSGTSVSSAGDINGDGYADLIIGARNADPNGAQSGESYVVFGKGTAFASSLDLSSLNGTTGFVINGIDAGDTSGGFVSAAGDVNGDGYGDLVIGALNGAPNGAQSGESYVVFGKGSAFASSLNLSSLDGTTGFVLNGIDASDLSGASVNSAGDVNGDGYDDIIIGAFRGDPNGSDSGESYVVFGSGSGFASSLNLSTLNGTNGFTINGIDAGDHAGGFVSSAGDINGDGYDDLLIAADDAAPNGAVSGETYVVFGKGTAFASTLELSTLNGTTGFVINGIDANDNSGNSVRSAGDVNGDGYDDLIIGARYADPNGSLSGEAYVVFGKGSAFSSSLNLSALSGTDGYVLNGLEAGDKFAKSVSGAGDINGDGLDDLIIGAYGGDPNGSGAGESYVILGQRSVASAKLGGTGSDTMTGTAAADILIGGQGVDTLTGGGGADSLQGGSGNDTIIIPDSTFLKIDGGTGTDTLRLTGANSTLDLSTLKDNKIQDIEIIDLKTDTNAQVLSLGIRDLLNMSSTSNTLKVTGSSNDSLNLNEFMTWGSPTDVGGGFTSYTNGAATIIVENAIKISGYGFPASFNMTQLNGANGFEIQGETAGDRFGQTTRSAGDVNGDGFEDLIIGAHTASSNTGKAYVVYGKGTAFTSTLDVSTLDGTNGFELVGGGGNDYAGFGVAGGGDINGDGFGDLIVPFLGGDNTATDAGDVYVIYGKATAFAATSTVQSYADGTAGFRFDGVAAGENAGRATSFAGDVNGDGFDDILIGAHPADTLALTDNGRTFIIFGKSSFAAVNSLNIVNGNETVRHMLGTATNEINGFDASALGDINNDGYDDFVVGTRNGSPNGAFSGEANVIFGSPTGIPAQFNRNNLNGTVGFTINGIAAGDYTGGSVRGAGDINGDGFDDIIVGAYNADVGANANAGEAYVVFGKGTAFASTLNLSTLDGSTGFQINGIDANDKLGSDVSGIGDFNGDGYDDILVGAPFADPNGNADAGEAFIIFGKGTAFSSSLNVSALDGTTGVKLNGIAAGDQFGGYISGAVDLNGDGLSDLVVGAEYRDPGGRSNAGTSSVIFGVRGVSSIQMGTTAADTLTGTAGGDGLIGGQGNDILISGGGTDTLRGGQGNDTFVISDANFLSIDGGRGTDVLRLTGSGFSLDLTSVKNNKITDIQTIDLKTDTAAQTVTMELTDIYHLTGTNNDLTITGTSADTVVLTDFMNFSGPTAAGAFNSYTSGTSTLLIENTITVTGYGFPSDFAMSEINGRNAFGINGQTAGDALGYRSRSAGDINGDGFEDLLVGAHTRDVNGAESGSVYVIYGKGTAFSSSLDVSTLDGTNGFVLHGGGANDYAGYAVSGGGDINGDGFDDMVISFLGGDNVASAAGDTYVIYGKSSAFATSSNIQSYANGTNGFVLNGVSANDNAGRGLSFAGDLNADGYDDLIIASKLSDGFGTDAGRTFIVYGKSTFASSTGLSATSETVKQFNGTDTGDQTGFDVSGLGDINGDGYSDLIVGAPFGDPNGSNSGESYVIFGRGGELPDAVNSSYLNGTSGFTINGISANDDSGAGVRGAGDINGDGYDDILIGADTADGVSTNNAGEAYVVFGKGTAFSSTLNLSTLNGSTGFRIDNAGVLDQMGVSLSGVGDFNGDGFDDIIVGAHLADANGNDNAGEAYIIFGKGSAFSSTLKITDLDGTTGVRLFGAAAGDLFGKSVAAAGDVNGDGFDDIVISADNADPGSVSNAGTAFVVFGDRTSSSVTLGTTGADTLTGTSAANQIIAGQGNDTITGAGGADTLRGGNGDDTFIISDTNALRIDGGRGADTLRLSGSVFDLDLTSINNNKFTDIETIDMKTDGNAHTLTLNEQEIIALLGDSSSNTLTVTGTSADTINLDVNSGFSAPVNAGGFNSYTIGAITLKVEDTVNVVRAGYSSEFELADLTGINGFTLNGIDADDRAGQSFRNAGDINGDGFDDILIGAHHGDPNGTDSGEAYVVYGKGTAFSSSIDLSSLDGTTGFRLEGIAGADLMGFGLDSAGDINGDGYDDIMISAVGDDTNATNNGEVYVIFGKSGAFAASANISTLINGTDGLVFQGPSLADETGRIVSEAGDVNGDGYDDFLITSKLSDIGGNNSGRAYLVFGKGTAFASHTQLGSLNGTNGFIMNGLTANDNFGYAASSAGDINGDGYDDIILGATEGDNAATDAGEVYVIYGKGSGFNSTVNLSSLSGSDGFVVNGEIASDHLGAGVSGGGDINGDGFDDFAMSADLFDGGGTNSGKVYVFFGKSSAFASSFSASTTNGTNGFSMVGLRANDGIGLEMSMDGDFNGDGYDDLVIGSKTGGPGGNSNAGEAYVVFGKGTAFASTLDLSTLDGTSGFKINGLSSDDKTGNLLSFGGDINGDGFDDLLVAAHYADPGGRSNAGEGYVIFGGRSSTNVTLGTTGADTLAGTAAADTIIAGQGNDTITGAGGADSLRGGEGADTFIISDTSFLKIDGGSGTDTLRLNAANLDLNFNTLANNKITDIEIIDLKTDGNNHTVTLSELDLLDITGIGNTLTIQGDSGDQVVFGDYFSFGDAVDQGNGFSKYSNGDADLIVENTITVVRPGFPNPLNLSTALDGTVGFTLNGIEKDDQAGFSVGSAGDINGDGYDDFLISANKGNSRGLNSGETYLLFGKSAAFSTSFNLTDLTTFVQSDFSSGKEGWVRQDINARFASDDLALQGGSSSPDYLSGGGSPGGAIRAGDYLLNDRQTYLKAPSKFIGDKSAYAGGTLSFDIRSDEIVGGTDLSPFHAVIIKGGGLTLSAAISSKPSQSSFTHYDLNLDSSTAWKLGNNNAALATDAQITTALSNITNMFIRVEYSRGTDRGYLDNVVLRQDSTATDGFVIFGENKSDFSGRDVSGGGDINGDGFDDLIISSRNADPGGNTSAGKTYVVYGKGTSFNSSLDLSNLTSSTGLVIKGIDANDFSGSSISNAGDVNGDGFDDLIIGAYQADVGANANAGEVYVVFGKGSGLPASLDLSSLDGTNGYLIQGIDAGDKAGFSVSGVGDLNGDGFDDVIIGANGAAPNANATGGESYVVFGKASGFGTVALSGLNGTTGFKLNGIDASDQSGYSVSSAGDVNGDGFDDLIIGAINADPNGANSGEAYVIFGKGTAFASSLNLSALNGSDGFVIKGIAAGDLLGGSVSDAGDVNGDGFDDILVGSSGATSSAGKTFVIFGKSTAFSAAFEASSIDGNNGFVINGIDGSDSSGNHVSSAGDINGDGLDDLIVGAFGGDASATSSGESYVIYGSRTNSTAQLGTTGNDTLTGTSSADVIIGGQGNDTITGGGGADSLQGGNGADTLKISDSNFQKIDGGGGDDTLILSGAGLNLDLTALKNNKIDNIENIDLKTDGNNHNLNLGLQDIFDMSESSNSLKVLGDAGDTVNVQSLGSFTNQGVSNGFVQYDNGDAVLLIEQGISVVGI